MSTELTVLALAGLLQIVQIVLMAVPANMQVGIRQLAGPRDEPLEIHGMAARLKRAMDNHFEALILFTIAVLVVTLGEQSTGVTETCAWVYLIARILYIPAYTSGIMYLRTFVWAFGLGATMLMLLAAVL